MDESNLRASPRGNLLLNSQSANSSVNGTPASSQRTSTRSSPANIPSILPPPLVSQSWAQFIQHFNSSTSSFKVVAILLLWLSIIRCFSSNVYHTTKPGNYSLFIPSLTISIMTWSKVKQQVVFLSTILVSLMSRSWSPSLKFKNTGQQSSRLLS